MNVPTKPFPADPIRIIECVASIYGVSKDDLLGTKRFKHINRARNVAISAIRKYTNMTLDNIGRMFSNRDHGTIHCNLKNLERYANEDHELRQQLNLVEKMIVEKCVIGGNTDPEDVERAMENLVGTA